MKKKVTVIGIAAIILSLCAVLLLTGAASNPNSKATEVRVTTLEKQDIEKTVSSTGTVYSINTLEVYSNMNYPVKTVNVEVGDRVQAGDVLAELDMSALESDISQRQASVWAQQSSANQNVATARSDLETYQRNLANGTDSNLVNAKSSVMTAELDVATAEIDVQTAEIDIQSARNSLSSARRDLREFRDREGYGYNDDYDTEYNRLKDNVRTQETNLEKSESNLEKVKGNLLKAKANLEKSEENYEAVRVSSIDNIAAYENKVKSAQASNNFNDQYISIEKMQADLEKGIIIAPVSGVITEVRAIQGGSGSGQLFVIQDADSLKVITNIKEYDISHVSVGDKVSIKADATGNEVFSGTLSKIAPTSTLTKNGSIQNSTTAEFECEASVSSAKSGLKIGMNTRLSIISEQKKGVYTVPHEAVTADGDVYVAVPQEDSSYIVEAIPVNTGMENDLRIEIISDSLTDGMYIIRNAEGIQTGMHVIPAA